MNNQIPVSRFILRAALPLMAAVLLVACGGGGGGDAAPSDTAPPAAAPSTAVDPATAGSIEGSVSFVNGEDPDVVLKMDADPVCAGLHQEPVMSQTREGTEDGKLANALVYVKSGLTGSFAAPSAEVQLEQRGCQYWPHVGAAMVGQTVKIVNNDPTLHNVHALPKANPEFNMGQPFQGMELPKTFANPEVAITFKCDVHPWMLSYIAILEHPYYAVTGADGSYKIANLPPGTYTIEVWHETLGTKSSDVTVGPSEAVVADIALGG
jgi:plastocyanin